jgi:hypothetical protein
MDNHDNQVLYNGRWIAKEHFRAFVYNSTGQRVAESYDEYADLISSGAWFAEPSSVPSKSSDVVSIVGTKRGRPCRKSANQ